MDWMLFVSANQQCQSAEKIKAATSTSVTLPHHFFIN